MNKKILFLTMLSTMFFTGTCLAAPIVNTGLPWDSVLTLFMHELTGPIPKSLAMIAVSVAGLSLMFGELGDLFKKAMYLVLGVGIAINASDWVNFISNAWTGDASSVSAVTPPDMLADNFLSSFMSYLITICHQAAYNLQGPVILLVIALTTLSLIISVIFDFEKDHIKTIFKHTLTAGFYVFLVEQWVGGTFGIMDTVFSSFEILGLKAAGMGVSGMVRVDDIIVYSLQIAEAIWDKTAISTNVSSMIISIISIVSILFCTFFMAIELIVTRVEFWVISTLSIPMLAFGILPQLKYLSEKAISGMFSYGFKAMVMAFIGAIAGPLMKLLTDSALANPNLTGIGVMARMFLACALLFLIAKNIPALAQTLMSGNPSLGGGSGMSSIKNAAGTAMAAATAPASMAASAVGFAGAASVMPGGGSTQGGSTMGTVANMGRLVMAKATSPISDQMSAQLHRVQKQGENGSYLKGRMSFNSGKTNTEDNIRDPKNK